MRGNLMYSTTDRPEMQRRDFTPVADAAREKILANRKTLPRALNGRAAPLAEKKAAQTRQHIQQEIAKPVHLLLSVLTDDVYCGVPLPTVLSVLDDMKVFLMVCAGDLPVDPRDLSREMLAETMAEGRFNTATMAANAKPGDPHALADLVRSSDEYQVAKDRLDRVARAMLAVQASSHYAPRHLGIAR